MITKHGILYYLRKRRDVHEDMFEPVSKSKWRLLREMSPSKSSGSYRNYIEKCNESYLQELENRKNVGLELTSIYYDLTDDGLVNSKREIDEIENEDGFNGWINKELVDKVRNWKNEE